MYGLHQGGLPGNVRGGLSMITQSFA
jgi:hypothetical protein